MIKKISGVINKALYMMGHKCKKAAWFEKNHPELKGEQPEPDYTDYQAVCALLPDFLGNCEVVDSLLSFEDACNRTMELISKGVSTIIGATFMNDKSYGRIAALQKNENGYDVIELTVATEKKEIKYPAYAYHTYVAMNSGVAVQNVKLVRINNKYILGDQLDVKEFLLIDDITELVMPLVNSMDMELEDISNYIEQTEEPVMELGCHCGAPGECAYWNHCARNIHQPSIFNINGNCMQSKKKHKLFSMGIETMEDLVNFNATAKKKDRSSDRAAIEAMVHAYNKPNIDGKLISEFLTNLRYPIYHMDFESVMHAIPIWKGENPYRQVCFQYSIHIEYEDGSVEHKEFLAKEGEDPRRAFAEGLCADIPLGACVTVYNQNFEMTRLRELANDFPDLADHLMDIHNNIIDLMVPFADRYFYTPEMDNSHSIKHVLPALCPGDPELDYHALEGIHVGTEAADAFKTLADHTPEEIAEIRKNLLAYCRLDTLAMVKVLEKIREVAA